MLCVTISSDDEAIHQRNVATLLITTIREAYTGPRVVFSGQKDNIAGAGTDNMLCIIAIGPRQMHMRAIRWWSPSPMDIRNPRRVVGALPISSEEGRPSQISSWIETRPPSNSAYHRLTVLDQDIYERPAVQIAVCSTYRGFYVTYQVHPCITDRRTSSPVAFEQDFEHGLQFAKRCAKCEHHIFPISRIFSVASRFGPIRTLALNNG
ncbi:hypothetical protein EVAR_16014_1 [Eumeta japonica]|uniref:Uncharacterized protein n=1 Tax=Eumeta variegata TaxID=151549 RepID=A0A4C1VXV1_EUMVA|nr:hypothetical protein EVAR_16014_1 [Eumeta japonica]